MCSLRQHFGQIEEFPRTNDPFSPSRTIPAIAGHVPPKVAAAAAPVTLTLAALTWPTGSAPWLTPPPRLPDSRSAPIAAPNKIAATRSASSAAERPPLAPSPATFF
jgi:hypothetical protein